MKRVSTGKVWTAGTVVFLSAVYLLINSLQSASFAELPVHQVRLQPVDSRVKVSGKVVAESTDYDAHEMRLLFTLVDEQDDTMQVVFNGIRPNAFRDDAQVMVEGIFDHAQGVLQADVLLAKCPSRYEEQGEIHPDAARTALNEDK